jgi:hypothetical protein
VYKKIPKNFLNQKMLLSRRFDFFLVKAFVFLLQFSYEPVHAKIERHFQKQNVIREDPQAYANRFGEQLCDPTAVIQQARAAGVLEDLVNHFFFH